MSGPPIHLGRAGDELVRALLGQYRQYNTLLAEQERALEADDLERFEELASELVELRGAIGSAAHGDFDAHPERVQEARDELECAIAATRRIEARLGALRVDGARRIKDHVRRGSQTRRYLAGPTADPARRLDVRL